MVHSDYFIFLSDGGAPKRHKAQDSLPSFPPLNGPAAIVTITTTTTTTTTNTSTTK